MTRAPQLERLTALVEPVVAGVGLELVKVECKGEGSRRLLRVYVDQPAGVGLEECERASRALSAALDEAEATGGGAILPGGYTLEVSSPGLDRPLVKPADFGRFAGQRAQLRTQEPIEGRRAWTGILQGADATGVRLQPEAPPPAMLTVAWGNLAQARLAPSWPAPALPGGPRRQS